MRIVTVGHSTHTRPFHSNQAHGLKYYLVRLQTEGFCQAIVNGILYLIRPGDVLLCKPGDTYELIIRLGKNEPPPSGDYFLSVDPAEAWIQLWWEDYQQDIKLNVGIDEMLISIWKHLVYEKRRVKDFNPDILGYLAQSMLLHLKRLIAGGESFNIYERSISYQIKTFIEKHATESITLGDVSMSVGLSISRASQLFKETFNQSVMDYAIEVRLSIAKERMLIGGSTLQEVAFLCGFANYTHFNRSFRLRYGVSPSEYKRQLRPQ
ncbi:helix-turn-helix domain-containing protein [Paenibacillus agricola]|uniref:Helix-turn-helix transcriptional regulator n=1 Tax=Paenibacillus agricola TaxID=2716264 RepID=A0ABX0J650_9BACL|nr:AraC family transcriptional regulator [Paenibacillus agricola]NHN31418.1 helix-turn-helix transcriptional regulator [Paenibacillus agricola]